MSTKSSNFNFCARVQEESDETHFFVNSHLLLTGSYTSKTTYGGLKKTSECINDCKNPCWIKTNVWCYILKEELAGSYFVPKLKFWKCIWTFYELKRLIINNMALEKQLSYTLNKIVPQPIVAWTFKLLCQNLWQARSSDLTQLDFFFWETWNKHLTINFSSEMLLFFKKYYKNY